MTLCRHPRPNGAVAYELQEDGSTLISFDCAACGKAVERRQAARRGLTSDPEKARDWQRRSRKPLRAKSARQRDVDRERREVCRPVVIARDGERCWAKALVPLIPCAFYGDRGLELHETVPRSLWREAAVTPEVQRLVCPRHHDWIEEDPAEARAVGLLASAPRLKES